MSIVGVLNITTLCYVEGVITDMLSRKGYGDTSKVVISHIRLSVSGRGPRSPIVVQRRAPAPKKNFHRPPT